MLSVCVLLYGGKKLRPGQYLDRSKSGAAVPADLTQLCQSPSNPPTALPSHYNLSSWCGILEIFLLKWNLQIWCCSRQKREYFMNQIFLNRYFRAGTSGSTSLTGENSQAKDVIIVTSRAGVSRCPAFWSSSSSPTRSSKGLYLVRNSVQIL